MERKIERTDFLYLLIIPFVVVFDLLSKWLVVNNLEYGKPLEVLGNFLRFTFIYNEGITFGMFSGVESSIKAYIVFGGAIVAIGVLLYVFFQLSKYVKEVSALIWAKVAIMLMIGGGMGNNIFDRLFMFNQPGKMAVVDFIDVGIGNMRFYIFNVADCFGVVGTIILGIVFIFFSKEKEKCTLETSVGKENGKGE